MRVTPLPLTNTVEEHPTLWNVPECGQFVGPVSLFRCTPNPLTKTSGDTSEFVPLLLCGQHGRPRLQIPVVESPSLVTAGIDIPPQLMLTVVPLMVMSPDAMMLMLLPEISK